MHMASDSRISRSIASHADHNRSADSIAHPSCSSDLIPSLSADSSERCRVGIAMFQPLRASNLVADLDPDRSLQLMRGCTADDEAPQSTAGCCCPSSDRLQEIGARLDADCDERRKESDRFEGRSDNVAGETVTEEFLPFRQSNNVSSPTSDMVGEELLKIATNLKPLNCRRGRDMDRSSRSDLSEASKEGIHECESDGCQSDLEGAGETTTTLAAAAPKSSIEPLNNTETEEEEECVTPTSAEFRIPEPRICPPAPRKKRHPPKRPRCYS